MLKRTHAAGALARHFNDVTVYGSENKRVSRYTTFYWACNLAGAVLVIKTENFSFSIRIHFWCAAGYIESVLCGRFIYRTHTHTQSIPWHGIRKYWWQMAMPTAFNELRESLLIITILHKISQAIKHHKLKTHKVDMHTIWIQSR